MSDTLPQSPTEEYINDLQSKIDELVETKSKLKSCLADCVALMLHNKFPTTSIQAGVLKEAQELLAA